MVNTYMVYKRGGNEAIVVDPAWHPKRLVEEAEARGLKIKLVLATHGHFDHILGAEYVCKATGAHFAMSRKDETILPLNPIISRGIPGGPFNPQPKIDYDLSKPTRIRVGRIELLTTPTPGHTPGSITVYDPQQRFAFTGDTLFKDSVGRTDLPGGSLSELRKSLKKLVRILKPETIIYPGHGPRTTLEEELRNNPFMRGLRTT